MGVMGVMIRTFIAIELPEQIKSALGEIQKDLRRTAADVSWTKPVNIHQTIKFLGDLDEARVGLLRKTTCESLRTARLLELVTGNIGFFPNQKRARVIWVGLDGDVAGLIQLQQKLDRALATAGFPAENAGLSPHCRMW